MKLKIHVRLLIAVLSTALLTYAVSILYISYQARHTGEKVGIENLKNVISRASLSIEKDITSAVSSLKAYTSSIIYSRNIEQSKREELYTRSGSNFLENSLMFANLSISLELSATDPSYNKNYGRTVQTLTQGDGTIISTIEQTNLNGDDFTGLYYRVKTLHKPLISKIRAEHTKDIVSQTTYKTTIYIPLVDSDDEFYGAVSADIILDTYKSRLEQATPDAAVAATLISDNDEIISSYVKSDNDSSSTFYKNEITEKLFDINKSVENSGIFFDEITDTLQNKYLMSAATFSDAISEKPWKIVCFIPFEYFNYTSDSHIGILIIIIIVGLCIMGLVISVISSDITNFINKTVDTLNDLALGNFNDIDNEETITSTELTNAINRLKNGLGKAVKFAEEIGRGNLSTNFKPLSEKDDLGLSLCGMRDSLLKAREEDDKRQEQDRKQNWATEGAAKFGDILRQYNNDMEDFSFNIISNLVKYIDANQGGLFVVNNDSKDKIYFELTAGYAYDIRKILKKRVEPGVGLIGRCILESQSIYINNLPDDYINITSGLGEKSPGCLLIVPFKFNNEIYAVAEIASFNEIDQYKREFVEMVGNSIASTIATVKINVRTNNLLKELKVQSEELASQEEEMRQNMEALKASQEDMSKKSDEYLQTQEALGTCTIMIEYDVTGRVININNAAQEFFMKSKSAVVDRHEPLYEFISDNGNSQTEDFWIQLCLGRVKHSDITIKVAAINFTLESKFVPVQNYYGKVYKIVCLMNDISKYVMTIG